MSEGRSDADQIIGLYRRHAAAFAAQRGRDLHEKAWLDRFLNLLPDAPSVLDIGCGFGEPIARYLLDQGCDVTGVDASPELIRIAQENLPQARWVLADMRGLEMGRAFNGILAWNSMFHLTPEDQRRMLAVFKAHARRGAALIFTSGPRHGVSMGRFEGEPLYHASLDADEYRDLLDRHGFEVVAHVAEDPECKGLTIWLARLREVAAGQ